MNQWIELSLPEILLLLDAVDVLRERGSDALIDVDPEVVSSVYGTLDAERRRLEGRRPI